MPSPRVIETFHCSLYAIQRSKGRSEVAAAAYRGGTKFVDRRTGRTHDFSGRSGVLHAEVFLPEGAPGTLKEPQSFLDALYKAAPRKDAVAMREVIAALPHKLAFEHQLNLGTEFVRWLVDRFKVAAYAAWHAPNDDGDPRNFHMHILLSAKVVDPSSRHGFGGKAIALDPIAARRSRPPVQPAAREIRQECAIITNRHLEAAGLDVRVDPRSLQERRREALLRWEPGNYVLLSRRPSTHVGVHGKPWSTQGAAPVDDLHEEGREDTCFPAERQPSLDRDAHTQVPDAGSQRIKLPVLGAIHGRSMEVTEEPCGAKMTVGPRRLNWSQEKADALLEHSHLKSLGVRSFRVIELSDGSNALWVHVMGDEVMANEDRVVFRASGVRLSPEAIEIGVSLAEVVGWPAVVVQGEPDFIGSVRKNLNGRGDVFADVVEVASVWVPWTAHRGYWTTMREPYRVTRWTGKPPPDHDEADPNMAEEERKHFRGLE